MPRTYRAYEFTDDTPYVGRTAQIKEYLDSKFANIDIDTEKVDRTIRHSVHESLKDVDCQFCGVHKHIECAKNEIIENQGGCGGCCEMATKQDIQEAVAAINAHTDSKFDEVDIPGEFADLNELVQQIVNRG